MSHDINKTDSAGSGPLARRSQGTSVVVSKAATVVNHVWFVLFAAALLGAMAFFGLNHQPTEMGIAAGACVLGMMLCRLEYFAKFKGLGIEAELREVMHRAEQATDEAYAKAELLRDFAERVAAISLETLAKIGLVGSFPDERKIVLRDEVEGILSELGARNEGVLRAARDRFEQILRLRHANKVRDAAIIDHAQALNVNPREHFPDQLKALQSTLSAMIDHERGIVPSIEEFREAIRRQGTLGLEVEARLEDLEYYIQHKHLRRPDVWRSEKT